MVMLLSTLRAVGNEVRLAPLPEGVSHVTLGERVIVLSDHVGPEVWREVLTTEMAAKRAGCATSRELELASG